MDHHCRSGSRRCRAYVSSWLAQHRSTTDTRTRVAAAAVEEDMQNPDPLWDFFVNCWSVALVNAKRLRRSLTDLQTRNTFCDVPSAMTARNIYENLYSPKIHGRYRQDTDMYKRQKQNNNTQYTLQHGSG